MGPSENPTRNEQACNTMKEHKHKNKKIHLCMLRAIQYEEISKGAKIYEL